MLGHDQSHPTVTRLDQLIGSCNHAAVSQTSIRDDPNDPVGLTTGERWMIRYCDLQRNIQADTAMLPRHEARRPAPDQAAIAWPQQITSQRHC
jgi:hypothetical protein